MNDIRIVLRRAKDLTDRDVIRLSRLPGYRHSNRKLYAQGQGKQVTGEWREVLDVYKDMDTLHAVYTPEGARTAWGPDMYNVAIDALDRIGDFYVLVRLTMHELSYGEYEDALIVLPAFELVETQSEPVWASRD